MKPTLELRTDFEGCALTLRERIGHERPMSCSVVRLNILASTGIHKADLLAGLKSSKGQTLSCENWNFTPKVELTPNSFVRAFTGGLLKRAPETESR